MTEDPQSGQNKTILLHQKTRPSGSPLPKPILRQGPKHIQQEQKQTEKKYFQKGLITNRNKPGLFTHHFNTAANYNRLKSVHTT